MPAYKILIDEKFYQTSIEQQKYLNDFLLVVENFFNAKLVMFEPFATSTKSYNRSSRFREVNHSILKTHKVDKYDAGLVSEAEDIALNNLGFTKAFVGKIKYILSISEDNIVVIPYIKDRRHRELQQKQLNDKIFFIGNFDQEVDSNIKRWIQQDELIQISVPSFNNKFPASVLCNGYNEWRSEILRSNSIDDKIATLHKIGMEVAERNKYTYDSKLTALNKRKAKKRDGQSPKRQVFKSPKLDVYLSTDFENGGYEVYNSKPDHQGQYKFNGDFEKEADDNSHPLYLK